MARSNMVHNPKKVTLYLPAATIDAGKAHAKAHSESFSHLVTSLVNDAVGGKVPFVVEVDSNTHKKLKAKAKQKHTSVANLIPSLLNEHLGS